MCDPKYLTEWLIYAYLLLITFLSPWLGARVAFHIIPPLYLFFTSILWGWLDWDIVTGPRSPPQASTTEQGIQTRVSCSNHYATPTNPYLTAQVCGYIFQWWLCGACGVSPAEGLLVVLPHFILSISAHLESQAHKRIFTSKLHCNRANIFFLHNYLYWFSM